MRLGDVARRAGGISKKAPAGWAHTKSRRGPLWDKLADPANLMTFCFVSGKDYHNSLSGLGLCPKRNFEGTRGESSSYTRGENGLFTDEFIEELEIRNERS